MKKPVLVIMAAGMGSRYGGLKQIDPIGPNGEVIIDYSLFEAKRAGFEKVVCIIKPEIEADFRAVLDKGASKQLDIRCVYQSLDDIPAGFSVPEGRVKPWGTWHAVRAARKELDAPFAVINADDYYGSEVFSTMFKALSEMKDEPGKYHYCMAGYRIGNTLSESGTVARGVCSTDKDGNLTGITERTKIKRNNGIIQFTEDDGKSWTDLPEDTLVSMNLFGFTESFIKELDGRFPAEIERILATDPLKGESYLPKIVSTLIDEGRADVKVLPCSDKWYGVTYKDDRPGVVRAMEDKVTAGLYPAKLWG